MIRTLYISYDGMTDPLGRSQVIPYLEKIAAEGFEVHLISMEKQEPYRKSGEKTAGILKAAGIIWHPLSYTKNPPVLSTLRDIFRMKKKASSLHQRFGFSLVHCRSYIASFAGLHLKKKAGVPFVFDMRGFYADERADGKIWNLKNPLYRWIFNYFKKKEKQYFLEADQSICLTNTGKRIIESWEFPDGRKPRITVIPCCADTVLFNPRNYTSEDRNRLREENHISREAKVIVYLGSTGTWYMLPEMLDFYAIFRANFPDCRFLFLTHDDPSGIQEAVIKKAIPASEIIIKAVDRQAVPQWLHACDLSIFFILPVFSKKASSPTKLAELLSMNIPLVCNSGVGDVDEIVRESKAGVIVEQLTTDSYEKVISELAGVLMNKQDIVMNDACTLSYGAGKYLEIYKELAQNHHPKSA